MLKVPKGGYRVEGGVIRRLRSAMEIGLGRWAEGSEGGGSV
jgi:hypothetical protein